MSDKLREVFEGLYLEARQLECAKPKTVLCRDGRAKGVLGDAKRRWFSLSDYGMIYSAVLVKKRSLQVHFY